MHREIVYNIYKHQSDFYLPSAYLSSIDTDGELAYSKQKLSAEQLEETEENPVHLQLMKIITALTPVTIENRFISDRRKIKDLNALLENITTKKTVSNFIDRKMDEFFQLIVDNNLHICVDLKRDSIIKNHLLKAGEIELEPVLSFERNDEGVRYRMQLKDENSVWDIHTKNIRPVCNNPAWIIADKNLCKIAYINANMVIPFRTKEEVFIPNRIVNKYFEDFILQVARKVDIEAKGFQTIIIDQLQKCRVETFQNFFSGKWEITLKMIYAGAEFYWNDKKANRTSLDYIEDDIQITKITRNHEAESKFVEIIKGLGLHCISGNSFLHSSKNEEPHNPIDSLEWLIDNKTNLKKAGFEVITPKYNNQLILLDKPILELNTTQQNDFFDVNAIIKLGDISISFAALKQNILNNDPYFVLSTGGIFVIPREWMAKYHEFFQFARTENNRLQFDKSQFTVLENIDIKTDILEEKHDFQISGSLQAELRPYQLEGVKWLVKLYHNGLGACLADDMGLGKTLQTIAVLLYAKEQKTQKSNSFPNKILQLDLFSAVDQNQLYPLHALIIMPASLIFNWQVEILKFSPSLRVYVFTGSKREKNTVFLSNFDVILTTYQTALRDIELLEKMEFDYVILDESQQIKNRKSKIFNALIKLKAKHKISLSGTPIENSLSDLWSQMHFINTDLLGNFRFFERNFLKPIEKYADEEKISQLKTLVQAFLLRRTKAEVEKNLPELLIKTHYSRMTVEQENIYEKEKSVARNYLLKIIDRKEGKYKLQILQVLTKLRQLANHPILVQDDYKYESGKFADVLEQWEIIHKSGHKVLIFSSFVKHLDLLKAEFDKRQLSYSYLTGNQTLKQRKQQIENFENDENVSSFLISIKAGGVGLNLTKADYVFILDPWWNPSTEEQAIARAHRIGQDKKVIAIKFITSTTLEEKILNLQLKKSKLAEDILSNNSKVELTGEDISYLLG